MNRLKAALFDLDGTLVDTENQYTIFWGNTCRKYRPDIPGLEYMIKGQTLVQIFDKYFPDPQIQKEIVPALNDWEAQMQYPWIPGALDFIADIRQHDVKCAVVTSSNRIKMESVAKAIPGFDQLFDRVLTSEDFTASKPAPDCFLLGAKIFECELEECLVFEDAFNGLKAGMASGIMTIGVATYNAPEVIKDKCHHVIKDFSELSFSKAEELLKSR